MSGDWQFLGWYYLCGERLVGPLSSDDLLELLHSGTLQPTDEVTKAWQCGEQVLQVRSRAGIVLGMSLAACYPPHEPEPMNDEARHR